MKLALNASQCYLKLGQPGPASQWAAVVAAVLPSPPVGLGSKAWYRLAEALGQLQHHECADVARGRAVELNPALVVIKIKEFNLHGKPMSFPSLLNC